MTLSLLLQFTPLKTRNPKTDKDLLVWVGPRSLTKVGKDLFGLVCKLLLTSYGACGKVSLVPRNLGMLFLGTFLGTLCTTAF